MSTAQIIHGDCIEVMRGMADCSVDAIVTDPPYELSFMGKKWDGSGIAYNVEMWQEALRVLKPGGHLLAFGGTRTYHRMACAIEDAGFEIRDCIQWLYGSGFPKSLDISKAIDKQAGAEREVIGAGAYAARRPRPTKDTNIQGAEYGFGAGHTLTAPATPEAQQWDGWGTALKPAHEPIVVARKPLAEKTVAKNVLAYGTGGLNIDGCRIGTEAIKTVGRRRGTGSALCLSKYTSPDGYEGSVHTGRWPANVILDEDAAAALDASTAVTKSQGGSRGAGGKNGRYGPIAAQPDVKPGYGDTGGASRFFFVAKSDEKAEASKGGHSTAAADLAISAKSLPINSGDVTRFRYQAKASRRERNLGLPDGMTSNHPTVKPIALMRYLVRLVTPPGGVVLDPFTGSGTTGCAAVLEGIRFIGIEQDAEYMEIARRRIEHHTEQARQLAMEAAS